MNNCVDAGQVGCPCVLAESGNCLVCSKLNGSDCNNCNWQGVCIYDIYHQNRQQLEIERTAKPFSVEEVRVYNPEFQVFVVRADRGFCQRAAAAGTYVFVRSADDDGWYDTPISVLKSQPDKGLLHLAVCGCGPKSKRLLSQKGTLLIRGIYRNGLSGMQGLREQPKNTFVFAKGIAVAPLRNFLDGGRRYLKFLRNLHLYVDLEKIGFDFFRDYFGDLPTSSISICDFTEFDFSGIEIVPEDNVFALTSPFYVERVRSVIRASQSLVYPVEGNFCCGEGICGACTRNDPKGNTIRHCKLAK